MARTAVWNGIEYELYAVEDHKNQLVYNYAVPDISKSKDIVIYLVEPMMNYLNKRIDSGINEAIAAMYYE